ncbi:VOC family protein [Aquimarina sp. U1-2]|uniref:VOC family protein n=1 Tax=Aquimarina sp. U1-2 TaxID=2823141 RepID=UPI001AEC744A|nr:VOC family protein [Aquimarina sp. U1-2]MBP2830785.1 VOC family protein [Aquimarina sp. U1-2]
MDVRRIGYILYVKKYTECIAFYQNILELNILFKNNELTCFDLFGTYLMVEKEDRNEFLVLTDDHEKAFSCLRIHVDSVLKWVNILKAKGLDIDYREHDWGTVAKFFDPDGNLLALKDEATFTRQMKEYDFSNSK